MGEPARALTRQALALWSAISGVTFPEVSHSGGDLVNGDAMFGATLMLPDLQAETRIGVAGDFVVLRGSAGTDTTVGIGHVPVRGRSGGHRHSGRAGRADDDQDVRGPSALHPRRPLWRRTVGTPYSSFIAI
jgi:hypothetical protein